MINSINTVDQYWCDSSKTYSVTIEFMDDASNLYVIVLDHITGAETELTYTGSVAGAGEFSYDSALVEVTTGDTFNGDGTEGLSDKITITTKLDYLQKTDITSNSNYDPEVLEAAYDNAVMLARQNKDSIGRSLTLAISDTGETMELPAKIILANSYLHFDENGNPEGQKGYLPRVYDPEFAYIATDIVPYNGDLWICKTGNTGTLPGSDIAYWEVYNQPKNEWDTMVSYTAGDIVTYGGELWLAVTPVDSTEPVSPAWENYANRYDFWDATITYPKNAITSYGNVTYDGTLIRSTQDGNLGHTPDLAPGGDETYWEVVKTGGAVIVEGVVDDTYAITALDLVYFDTDGTLSIGDKGELSKSILSGFATTAGAVDKVIEVQSKGLLDGFTGLTVGTRYYLGDTGGYCTKGEIEYQDYVVSVGVAKSATIMDVNIGLPEPTRNQDDGNPIGSIKYFSTYKDRSAYGYLPFAFDNAISQANYPVLFAEIGHVYNAQHVAVGDTDLSASSALFYPTPIPGAYDRVGIPDIDLAISNFSGDNIINIDFRVEQGFSRPGTPILVVADSGSSLPNELVDDKIYYVNAGSIGNGSIGLFDTEEEAIVGTAKISFTGGSGTFRLTQEGITLEDAIEDHEHIIKSGLNTGGDQRKPETTVDIGQDGTDTDTYYTAYDVQNANVTNETRPKTNYSFGYIKAEHVTSAGEPISALRYDTGWILRASADWENQLFTVTHGLNANPWDLLVEVWLAEDDTPTNAQKITNITRIYETVASEDLDLTRGISILEGTDTSNLILHTADGGISYLNDTDGTIANFTNGSTGAYKVVVTKPNLINTVFDVSSLPKTYDLTAANVIVTLPAINGVIQTRDIFWENGGVYSITIRDADLVTIETGSGDGNISLISDGSEWKTRYFTDV